MRRIKSIIKGYDFAISILLTLATAYILPDYINMKFALSFFNVCMTILSIIFSLFFAAMAILVSSSDNDFIDFLEEKKVFTELLWSFKFTLSILFLSLIISIFFYLGTSYWLETYDKFRWLQYKWLSLLLLFFFIYGMLATWMSVIDIVKFSSFRLKFLKQQRDNK